MEASQTFVQCCPKTPARAVLWFASGSTEDSGRTPVLAKNMLNFAAQEEAVQGYLGLWGIKREISKEETKALGSKKSRVLQLYRLRHIILGR